MPLRDYTVAMDDWFTQRLSRCVRCGRGLEERHVGLWTVHGVALLVVRCRRCAPEHADVQALLEARYAPDRYTRGGER